jgi:uncharacterized BrkB/YihY/UPF0761 family membrane protein
MTEAQPSRPARPWRASRKTERIVTWTLWALLLIGGTTVGVSSLVVGIVDTVLTSIAAANGQDVDGWAKLAWYYIAAGLLLVLPWSVLAVIISGVRRRRRVWYWPAAAIAVTAVLTSGMGRAFGYF